MLRALVLLLVLANALAWAYGRGHLDFLGWVRAEQREPQRLSQQIAPERIRVVDGGTRAGVTSGESPSPVSPAPAEALQETRDR